MLIAVPKRKISIALLVVFLISLIPILNINAASADTGMEWKSINSAKSSNYRGIAQNDSGLFVVVGDDGIIKSSRDLSKWEVQNSGTREYLFGCAWGNGKFVAAGHGGTILYSADGAKWTKAEVGNTVNFNGVVWADGKFLAIGTEGDAKVENSKRVVLSSEDGVQWVVAFQSTGSFSWDHIVFANHLYIVLGYSDYAFSQDGSNWTEKAMPEGVSFNDILWDGSQYIAIGGDSAIFTSKDAVEWTAVETNIKKGLFFHKIIRFSGKYILVIENRGACLLLSSTDLRLWSMASEDSYSEISGFIVSKDTLIAAGWYESILQTKDCTQWNVSQRYAPLLTKVIWSGQQFLSTGNDGTVFISKNGSDWTASRIDCKDTIVDVVWTGTKYAALSAAYSTEPNTYGIDKSEIYSSQDGITWNYTGSINQKNIERLFYFDNRYFALGRGGEILVSNDAITWTAAKTNSNRWLRGLAWNGKRFVCVGMFGEILSSADGMNWTKQDSKCECDFNSVIWNGRTFAVAGGWKTISSSNDGITWNTVIGYTDCTFEDVIWDGEKFLFVQNIGSVYTSKNMKSLALSTAASLSSPESIAWNGECFVMVGRNGSMAVCVPKSPVKVKISGAPVVLNDAPQTVNGKIVFPAKEMAEKLGASFTWNEKAKTVKVVKGKSSIVFTIGGKAAIVNGKATTLDVPASVINGIVMISAKFTVEKLGAKYSWDNASKTMLITR